MDNLPREFTEDDIETLRDLAENVEKELKAGSKGKSKKKVVESPPD
jgi:hypothetical protein